MSRARIDDGQRYCAHLVINTSRWFWHSILPLASHRSAGWVGSWALIIACIFCLGSTSAQTLDAELQTVPVKELAAAARSQGDATRGAVVFFQPQLACSKCHTVDGKSVDGKSGNLLGPDLTAIDKSTTDDAIVESVLQPSKVIRKEFASVSILTNSGNLVTAFLVEQSKDKVVARDVGRGGQPVTFAADEIETIQPSKQSIMPAGQMNQLNSRQQFLDLVRYLMEIRDGGAARALQLQPSAALLTFTVPEYESHLDHAGLISSWNGESLAEGEAIYRRVCANCHGTREQPGSLPTSLRFAEGKFKNGSDPLSMYRTMTHGFGLMAPQTWMVPVQKYDVIHYVRETYLKPHNPSQYAVVDRTYLDKLPKGDTFGPEPSAIEAWSAMDYGPSLAHTFQVPGQPSNFAYKGIAVRLDPGAGGVSRGRHWMVFDTDTLRMAAGWSSTDQSNNKDDTKLGSNENASASVGVKPNAKANANAKQKGKNKNKANSTQENFIDWRAIQFNGEHGVHPRLVGKTTFVNSTGPGWADPIKSTFEDDQRVLGRDGKRYGPLPRAWGKFKGLYHYGQQVIFSYSIGSTDVLEMPGIHAGDNDTGPWLLRTLNIGPRDRDLMLQVADLDEQQARISIDELLQAGTFGLTPSRDSLAWSQENGKLKLRIAAGQQPARFTIWQKAQVPNAKTAATTNTSRTDKTLGPMIANAEVDLSKLTKGGPPRWPQTLTTETKVGADDGPFAADFLTAPDSNPWLALLRFTGLDFFDDGRMAVCTWDGDVWIVSPGKSNAPGPSNSLSWQRIASGMFQPLGLKIVGGKIHLTCRDQLAVLHDLNGDEEIDFYQCLNNDHQVTEHFHEFAMGLQIDAAGNFYYAKSGCHGKAAVVPHHGTLLRVSPDGARTEILANGFRAANGVCLNPDGSFFVTDQEGFWNPKNRINWVTVSPTGKPNFYGNMLGYHDVTDSSDSAMEQPLCWITNEFDRSPAELLWVDSTKWGALNGSLLNLSYGYGKVFVVPHEIVHGKMQGGMIELPLPNFPTGVMRGRFQPADGHLYLCGMFAWAGNATQPGGLYRLRATGRPMNLPTKLHATKSGIQLQFTDALDQAAVDVNKLSVKTWSLQRTANYGSKHFDEKFLKVNSATISSDGKSLTLEIPEIRPTWCMEIKYNLQSAEGKPIQGTVHNTVHELE